MPAEILAAIATRSCRPSECAILIAAYLLMINATSETAGRVYLLIVMGFAILVVIFKFILNAYLAFGKWQTFPEGPEASSYSSETTGKAKDRGGFVHL